jgi:DNA-binding MarR family transcriptional regulator
MSRTKNFDQLKLENQLCFPFYAVSRLIIRAYQPYLDKLGITYPQYLVMLVLWENDGLAVNEISKKLILNTNTLTPLLKRLQTMGLINRNRSGNDERKVMIHLSPKGSQMQLAAVDIPKKLSADLNTELLNTSDLLDLKQKLQLIINSLVKA